MWVLLLANQSITYVQGRGKSNTEKDMPFPFQKLLWFPTLMVLARGEDECP